MQIVARRVDNVVILNLQGQMTHKYGSAEFEKMVGRLCDQGERQVLVNLESVPYLDAAGLGAIVRSRDDMVRKGGKISLCNLTERLQDVLVITKLTTVFDIFDNEAEALASFS